MHSQCAINCFQVGLKLRQFRAKSLCFLKCFFGPQNFSI